MTKILKYIFRAYRYKYKLDPNEIKYINTNLSEGSVAADIGAHKGGYLYWMRRIVKSAGKIYAFEPQVKLYNYLISISVLAKYKNVIIENLGLSSEEGEVNFFIPKSKRGDSPGARIDILKNKKQYKELTIQITTLDKYFLDRKIFPELIKIDVEGHEKQVLLGGINLLKSCKPKILMECENRHLKEGDIFDVFDILLNLGYNGFFFENKKLKSINEYDVEIHQNLMKDKFNEKNGYINNFIFEYPVNN